METKRRRRLLNALMVVLILVIAFCGVMAVGSIRGWFSPADRSQISVKRVTGVVNIERKGVGYSLKSGQTLMDGDVVETKQGSQVELSLDDQGVLALNEHTEAVISSDEKNRIQLEIENGELFADTAAEDWELQASFRGNTLYAKGAVLSVSVQAGSASVNVYAGEAEAESEDGSRDSAGEKETLSLLTNAYDQVTLERGTLAAESLNEFLILQAQKCTSKNELCFSVSELQKVLDDREAQKQAALEASLNSGTIISSDSDQEKESGEAESTGANRNEADPSDEAASSDGSDTAGSSGDADTSVSSGGTDTSPSGSAGTAGSSGGADTAGDSGAEAQPSAKRCTIEIRCDTILDNMDELSSGKEAYVPANGCILSASTVEFAQGETVFDVLTRVCDYAGIQIEYSWTPMYNSYYIEGINQLYEFDCGNESGWMYKVNGWFPNYGCSSYTLEDGDVIVWCYTCALGDDVGGGMR